MFHYSLQPLQPRTSSQSSTTPNERQLKFSSPSPNSPVKLPILSSYRSLGAMPHGKVKKEKAGHAPEETEGHKEQKINTIEVNHLQTFRKSHVRSTVKKHR
ncbi:hypothetical protein GYMLUDRAFT_265012 [Collybiopsis luxurians FD-317 M1]|uniref:Uncharacterized protein n=1 Tax=Collybiopsis luxurians FD-317 M1 TaxID=944289 RepID=A0A0D0BV98_9AGAR|nr:hypothetical protein GYMLUDRAFT_265012 [Collybiopsis luxurians FD-317 M1]